MSSGNGNKHGIPVANLKLALFHLTRDVTNTLEGPRISVLPSSVWPGRSQHLRSCYLFTQFCIDLSVVDYPIPQTNSGPVKAVLTLPVPVCVLSHFLQTPAALLPTPGCPSVWCGWRRLTGRQLGVFQELSQEVHGSVSVKEAKKKRSAQAMITL